VIIYVRGEFLKYVKDLKIINKRICYLRLKAKWFSCILINVHAPTNKKMEEVKEEFFNLIEQNINQISNSDIKIILGDFNAKAGKGDIYKPTTGNESLHNETNNNGIKMIQFAISKDFNTRSTFPHKDNNKTTWYSAENRTVNQTVHVLISNRFRSAITDTRELSRPDTESDHKLLKVNFREKFMVKTEMKNCEYFSKFKAETRTCYRT